VKYVYNNKQFLSDLPGDTSSILLEAEDSDNGTKKSGTYVAVITDNHSRVEPDFYLGTAKHRRQAMRKVDRIITNFVRFGHALMKEEQAIEKASKKPPKPPKQKSTKRKKGNLGNAT
jgi:hypothetical protein